MVEGWLHDDAVPEVLRCFDSGEYRGILTTGGPLTRGTLLADFGSFAELAAETLVQAGVPPETIQPITALAAARDRTYASAVAVREWLDNEGTSIDRVDVVSKGVHARRSRLLFQMALGTEVEVGVIALPTTSYDAESWWSSSAGVRTVIGEAIAYLYAKFMFYP